MQYRKLGTSDIEVSVIGFGCWAMGKAFWGEDVVDDETMAAVDRAIELDLRFFDTAQAYGCGHSERVLGKALAKYDRGSVVIATKTGLTWDAEEHITNDCTPEYVLRSCDESCERLGTDYLDLLQVHWPDKNVPIAETADAMRQLLESGKIRAVGVSNYSVEQMKQFLGVCPLHSLQPPYSMIRRDIEAEILPFCRENSIGVLAYSPMARGLLTGRYDESAVFVKSDARSSDGLWQGERLKRNVEAVREMEVLAKAAGHTMAQLALAWVVSQPGLSSALAGAKRPSQIEETAGAGEWVLDADMLAKIGEIIQRHGAG